jgi:uncharacterized protein YjbI with pentapeptide repeats
MPGGDLRGAVIHGVQARYALLDGCDFTDAYLLSGDFRSARMRGARLRSLNAATAKGPPKVWGWVGSGAPWIMGLVDFTSADLVQTDFRGARLPGARFDLANLRKANLAKTDRFGVTDLRGASFKEAKFCEASLRGALLDKSDLSDARFSGGFLSASLIDATLIGATFYKTEIGDANFTGADLTGAEFLHVAVPEDATFTRSTIKDVVFRTDNRRKAITAFAEMIRVGTLTKDQLKGIRFEAAKKGRNTDETICKQ